MKRVLLYCLIMAGAPLAVAAAVEAGSLDVKTGLWEVTVQSEGAHGEMPMPQADMQKLSPQQRAALERMKTNLSKPRTMMHKECITQEKLEKSENAFLAAKPGMKCNNKLSKNTSTTIAGTMQCVKDSTRETGDFVIEAIDREHVKGTTNITVSDGKRTMTNRGTLSGKWISASCGNTK